MRSLRRFLLAVSLLLGLAGTGRSGEWFDDYERGVEALHKQQPARAVELLERAIRKRDEPGTNVLTYGTNRLAAYHPYLKLAEAQALAGNLAGAREALRRSEEKKKEPPEERARVAARVETLERAQHAASPPPPSTQAAAAAPPLAPPMAASAPATLAAAPMPMPSPSVPPPVTTLAAAAKGVLELNTEPPGAAVRVAGRLLGVTPLRLEQAPGAVPIHLSLAGHADEVFVARLEAGRVSSETRRLTANSAPSPAPEPVVASLIAFSDPPGASVYVDDEFVGTTDPQSGRLVKSDVPPGRHRVRFALAGRGEATQEVAVAASGPTTVRVSLAAPESGQMAGLAIALLAAVVLLGGAAWALRRRPEAAAPPPHDATRTVVRPVETGSGATATRPVAGAPAATPVSPPTRAVDASLGALVEVPTQDLAATDGQAFGGYVLHEQLGRGGMATVFRAERRGESVALKRPLGAFLEDAEFMERFLREAEIGRTLHHPNIIRIFERGEAAGIPYFTMELIRGETLAQRLRERGRFPAREAAGIVGQVAEALDYAHLKGVVHRDLKPSNIMILADGVVKVMDYGIARARRFEGLTVTGAFLGTPDYVAPETAEGRGTDARSDLYALGVVFFEVLAGRKLFPADTPFAILRKHCSEPPPPLAELVPDTPPEVEAMVQRLLTKSPADRYQTAEDLLIDLRSYLNRAA